MLLISFHQKLLDLNSVRTQRPTHVYCRSDLFSVSFLDTVHCIRNAATRILLYPCRSCFMHKICTVGRLSLSFAFCYSFCNMKEEDILNCYHFLVDIHPCFSIFINIQIKFSSVLSK